MKYQWGKVLPHFIRKYILRRKGLTEPRLYKFDLDEYQGASEEEEVKTA